MLTMVSLNYRIKVGFYFSFAYLHFLYQTCLSFVKGGRVVHRYKHWNISKNPSLRFWGTTSEHSQLTSAPHGRAGRGYTIPQMPRRLQITCMALECTRGIMGLSSFLGVHIQKTVKLHCKELSGHFHFQNLVMAWRNQESPIPPTSVCLLPVAHTLLGPM